MNKTHNESGEEDIEEDDLDINLDDSEDEVDDIDFEAHGDDEDAEESSNDEEETTETEDKKEEEDEDAFELDDGEVEVDEVEATDEISETDDIDYNDGAALYDPGITYASKIDAKDLLNITKKILERRMTGNQAKVSKATKKKYRKETIDRDDAPYYGWGDMRKKVLHMLKVDYAVDAKVLELAIHKYVTVQLDDNKGDNSNNNDNDNNDNNDSDKPIKELYIKTLYRVIGSLRTMLVTDIIQELTSNVEEYDSIVYKALREQDDQETRNMLYKPIIKDGYVCPKCQSTKTITDSRQTRSSDEPMTEFSTCTSCGFKWKK
jgi:DNA-directed RNA polymerase subunit M/transcription elongation factor TFIIS